MIDKITELLIPIIRGMCTHPEALEITESQSGGVFTITLSPHTADYRILCGKGGRQIRALQFLVNSFELRGGRMMHLALRESFNGKLEDKRDFTYNPEFDCRRAVEIVREFCEILFARKVDITFRRKKDTLKITVETDPARPDEMPTVAALADVFYPYGFRQGCVIKIRSNHEADRS
jgi:predicted RNA-binding protein YlqC (UPF0109 family)